VLVDIIRDEVEDVGDVDGSADMAAGDLRVGRKSISI
jgi:hypothetical protein